jgi:hypothetical protein
MNVIWTDICGPFLRASKVQRCGGSAEFDAMAHVHASWLLGAGGSRLCVSSASFGYNQWIVLRRSSEERNRRETAAAGLKIGIIVVLGNVNRVLHTR